MYYCVDDPNPPYKGVRGKGKVKIHEDINHNIPIAEKIMVRYLGSLEHPMAKALMSSVKKGDSVILELSPNYYSIKYNGEETKYKSFAPKGTAKERYPKYYKLD